MIWIIIGVLMFFAVPATFFYFSRDIEDIFYGVLIGIMAAVLIGGIGNIISGLIMGYTYELRSTVNIKAISDTSSTSGKFFLGFGSIDSEPAFWYYADLGTHAKLRQVPAENANVIESDGTPRLLTYRAESKNNFWSVGAVTDGDSFYLYEFYIPEGSIVSNFELDARP